MQYVGDPAHTLSQLAAVPAEAAADEIALAQWILECNNTAPLTPRRLVDAIQTYVKPDQSTGFILDLTPEGGVHDGPAELARLAAGH